MEFPETIPDKSAQWATLCYDRSPEFKLHSGKGLASSAIANKKPYQEIALYEHQNGVWTKVWEYVKPDLCRCGTKYIEACTDRYRRHMYNLDPEFEGRVMDAPVICYNCWVKATVAQREADKEEREREELARLQAIYDHRPHHKIGGLENLTQKDS